MLLFSYTLNNICDDILYGKLPIIDRGSLNAFKSILRKSSLIKCFSIFENLFFKYSIHSLSISTSLIFLLEIFNKKFDKIPLPGPTSIIVFVL